MKLIDLVEIEKIINSELASKISKTSIDFNELLVETNADELLNVIQFLKTNNSLKFRQLIEIAGVDYPEEDKRFQLVYLLLSHEINHRIKVVINFELGKKIPTLVKLDESHQRKLNLVSQIIPNVIDVLIDVAKGRYEINEVLDDVCGLFSCCKDKTNKGKK